MKIKREKNVFCLGVCENNSHENVILTIQPSARSHTNVKEIASRL